MQFGLPWSDAEVAREAEDAGVAAFCNGDYADRDAYFSLAEMIGGTRKALVGPAIAYGFSRSPFAHATAIRQAAAAAPGRVFLGLGSSTYAINRDWVGVAADKPVERMSDLIAAVKAWLCAENGQRVRHEGPYYRIDARVDAPVLGRLEIPVLLAAFNRRMAAASARVADGVIGHALFTDRWWNEAARPAMQRGAAQAARATPPLEHGLLLTAIDDADPARAVADARRMVAFYLTTRTYDPFVELHGWKAQVEILRGAFRKGDFAAAAAAVSDKMLAAIAVCGTTADARRTFAARRKAGGLPRDLVYLTPPNFLVSTRRVAAYSRASLTLLQA